MLEPPHGKAETRQGKGGPPGGDTKTPEQLSQLFRRMQKHLAERILAGELTAHLGYAPGEEKPSAQPNHRNGSSAKTVLTETGAVPLDIPRDCDGSLLPQLVPTGGIRVCALHRPPGN